MVTCLALVERLYLEMDKESQPEHDWFPVEVSVLEHCGLRMCFWADACYLLG